MHHREHQAQAQKTLNTHVLYMTCLDALSWRKATEKERQAAMENPQFVKDLAGVYKIILKMILSCFI